MSVTRRRCFLIGHRVAPDKLTRLLTAAIEQHITVFDVTEFIVGHYGGFDRLAAKALAAAKERHPGIVLLVLTPYHPAERAVSMPDGFDDVLYPSDMENTPRRYAILRVNRYMIEHSDYLIIYARYPGSNTRRLFEYAEKLSRNGRLRIVNLSVE